MSVCPISTSEWAMQWRDGNSFPCVLFMVWGELYARNWSFSCHSHFITRCGIWPERKSCLFIWLIWGAHPSLHSHETVRNYVPSPWSFIPNLNVCPAIIVSIHFPECIKYGFLSWDRVSLNKVASNLLCSWGWHWTLSYCLSLCCDYRPSVPLHSA